jgi:hypothetical protein
MITGSYETDVVLAIFIQFLIVSVFGYWGYSLLEPETKEWGYFVMIIGVILFVVVRLIFDVPTGMRIAF